MKKTKIKNIIIYVINISVFILLIFFAVRLSREKILLKDYILSIEEKKKIADPISHSDLLKYRNFVLNDIDYSSGSIAQSRPKIGWSVRQILNKRKGLCGEGARLLYHILRKKGIESRRIYLHGANVLHVILEYKNPVNDKWILLETINGPGPNFLKYLDEGDKTLDSLFSIGNYRYHVIPDSIARANDYSNYSYYPFNGMVNNKFFKTEIYVHKRPNSLIHYFLEKHEMFLFLVCLTVLILLNISSIKNHTLIIYKKVNNPKN